MTIEHMKANYGSKAAPVQMTWQEGVPMPLVLLTGTAQAAHAEAENVRVEQDKQSIVSLIRNFELRGERVTTSSQGNSTVFRLLKSEPDFPPKTDSDRLMQLLRSLETDGRISRSIVKTPDRKQKEVFKSAPIPPANSEMKLESLPLMCGDVAPIP